MAFQCGKCGSENIDTRTVEVKNWLPWIIGGVGLVVIAGLAGLVFYFWNKSKGKEADN